MSPRRPRRSDIAISDLQSDTTANRTAIATQLANLFAVKGAVSTVDDPLTLYRGWIEAAIDRALGGLGFTLQAPADDIVIPTGSLPVLGNITYP